MMMPRALPSPRLMRLLPVLLLALGGCASELASLQYMLPEMPEIFSRSDRPDPLPEISTAEDGTPSLRLSWRGRRAIALLVQQHGETRLWRSQGGVVVATDGARITALAGLRQGIASSRLDGPDPLNDTLLIPRRPVALRRQLDLIGRDNRPEGMRFGVMLNCRVSATTEGEALLVREQCNGAGTRFTNRYWADPVSGGVWRSEQWVGEAGGMMEVEVVTPPSS
ncbi:YjbF family lipoprotein [Roseomonas sp. GC11]|uniref:YjbF family lipoprotein n=1 Tax=Roseomonas sp. GC11 TaxID=2950546 RepID=UPI00210E28A8|nr:YjbF family lipoprotein [Roseomonas sp. GC11]MCQ4161425.1 YjbF family lipoprotein [Roseomonas sp. GC11]